MFFEKHPVLFRMRESYRVPINLPKPPKPIPSPTSFPLAPHTHFPYNKIV